MPFQPAKHRHAPSTQSPLCEHSFGQACSHKWPLYPGSQSHTPSRHLPCPLQSSSHDFSGFVLSVHMDDRESCIRLDRGCICSDDVWYCPFSTEQSTPPHPSSHAQLPSLQTPLPLHSTDDTPTGGHRLSAHEGPFHSSWQVHRPPSHVPWSPLQPSRHASGDAVAVDGNVAKEDWSASDGCSSWACTRVSQCGPENPATHMQPISSHTPFTPQSPSVAHAAPADVAMSLPANGRPVSTSSCVVRAARGPLRGRDGGDESPCCLPSKLSRRCRSIFTLDSSWPSLVPPPPFGWRSRSLPSSRIASALSSLLVCGVVTVWGAGLPTKVARSSGVSSLLLPSGAAGSAAAGDNCCTMPLRRVTREGSMRKADPRGAVRACKSCLL
mmetsp:Transcript_52533/g.132047  ORF Transcript_52533/g.132047 Transcript_52533/m.132047 type:complete len:383 (-) Transcript_52533:879-2027(-)